MGLLLAKSLFHTDILHHPELLNTPDAPNVLQGLRAMQLIQSTGTFILPFFLFAFLISPDVFVFSGLHKRPVGFLLLMAFTSIICLMPLINLVAAFNEKIPFPRWVIDSEKQAAILTRAFLDMNRPAILLLTLLIVAVIPAIGEECLFRGGLQPLLIRMFGNSHVGIWVTALLFSAMHMQFLGFFPRVLLGAAFGYFYLWSGNLWLCIAAHMINNGLAVVHYYAMMHWGVGAGSDTLGADTSELWLVAAGTAGAGIAIFTFYKVCATNKTISGS